MVKPTRPAPCALTARGTTWRVLAERHKKHIFASAERGRAQAFPLFAFLGKLSYMSGKIILYDRENYKQGRKNLLLYNFHDVLLSENSLDFRVFFLEENFPFLNYP
ncbi:MAG: hypothetical protein MSA20_02795 [Bacteroidales bacterium]|nr:hypothetical protein [Bacteroidales bacterium]